MGNISNRIIEIIHLMLNNKDTMAICNVNLYLLLILLGPTVEIT